MVDGSNPSSFTLLHFESVNEHTEVCRLQLLLVTSQNEDSVFSVAPEIMGVGLTVVTLLVTVMQGVFGKTWDVKLPQSIMGISGSCITVPCHFEVPDDQEANVLNCSNSGMWRRGSLSGPIVINSQDPTSNQISGGVTGDLTKKNCTTVLHRFPKDFSDTYFFRLECPQPLIYTFSTGVNIRTQTAPPTPVISFVSHVSEGAQSADGQMTMTSTLTFVASADHHNQNVVCSVSYPLSAGGSTESSAASQQLNVLCGIEDSVLIPYVLCGVMFVLFVLTVAVDLYKYRSLSGQLKELVLKTEHTYTDLRTVSIKSDYEQIQMRQQ
ncbi:hypothetical protein INR49_006490 [Caranx melampygus]|nr:hypothetical protein INR49_006490 [Caranx melampygus]